MNIDQCLHVYTILRIPGKQYKQVHFVSYSSRSLS